MCFWKQESFVSWLPINQTRNQTGDRQVESCGAGHVAQFGTRSQAILRTLQLLQDSCEELCADLSSPHDTNKKAVCSFKQSAKCIRAIGFKQCAKPAKFIRRLSLEWPFDESDFRKIHLLPSQIR